MENKNPSKTQWIEPNGPTVRLGEAVHWDKPRLERRVICVHRRLVPNSLAVRIPSVAEVRWTVEYHIRPNLRG